MRLHGVLRRYRPAAAGGAPHHPFVLELPSESSVLTIVNRLALPDGRISVAALNGEAVNVSQALHDGDQVALFPPVAGGDAG